MKVYLHGLLLALLVGFSTFLFLNEKAAEPGPLRRFHQDVTECASCHEPWKGVSDDKCLGCHSGGGMEKLMQKLKFHESNRFCANCHKEHGGAYVSIAKVDHNLLNENLLCSQCHFDRHARKFGRECRECHLISSWKVKGYRHPLNTGANCQTCHNPPDSHSDDAFWGSILQTTGKGEVDRTNCGACHSVQAWPWIKRE